VEQAVREVVRERVNVHGASRTDAGVHARGQVAAFTCSGDDASGGETSEAVPDAGGVRGGGWPVARGVERLARAVNGKLPEDVRVMGVEVVGPAFDPVNDATSKAYSYTIHNAKEAALWDRWFVQHVYDALDVSRMQEAAQHLVGEHDFVSFAALHHGRLTTVRRVLSCEVSEHMVRGARRVRIDVSGTGFLYNMVRIIAGTLVEVGRGRMAPGAIPAIISSKDRRNAGPTLDGRGLCLEWIMYEGSLRAAQAGDGA
jgi:tRNA pseudouridine38-40 synthase